jgi:hypothetical protein
MNPNGVISDNYSTKTTMNLALWEIYMDLALLTKDEMWFNELMDWKKGRLA